MGTETDMAHAQAPTRPKLRRNGPPQAAGRPRAVRRQELDLRFGGGDLLALRGGVEAYASEFGPRELVDDVVLVVYELATNAVRHGGGSGRLELWRENGKFVCRVSDSGPGLADPMIGTRPPALDVSGGRGLWIAHRLSSVKIDTGAGGTTVTAAMPI
jgi:anti-sigma regulatory factor (Ser/Thr protein kinase)